MQIDFIGPEHRLCAAARDHARSVYRDTYGADLRSFAPLLVAARNCDGQIVCVAGIRTAADGFFSDTYLGGALDQALSLLGQGQIVLDSVIEVVSLASTSPFPVLPVLDAIIGWGRARGMGWGLFTATAPLRRLLRRAGLPYTELCAARPEALPGAESWGSYYQRDPWVCLTDGQSPRPATLHPRTSPFPACRAEAS
ncbi:MAG: thermostable hemolysin [Paracoccaceae bacterium]|nr:thermostable hemolysin [Paracoccaceae bacterium]